MGAKHPQEVLKKLNAGKCEFILAARHLVRKGIVKSPADAIRYMEDNNSDVNEIIEQYIISKQTKIATVDEEEDQAE